MYTDSHCHLSFPELAADLPRIREAMAQAQVTPSPIAGSLELALGVSLQ